MTHPYKRYEGTALWSAIEDALNALVASGDVEVTAHAPYVVGYLCDQVAKMRRPED